MKRLLLGLTLIALASSVLLASDCNGRTSANTHGSGHALGRKWTTRVVKFKSVLEVGEGVLDSLGSQLAEARDFEVKIGNVQGDMATLSCVVDAALADGAQMLITIPQSVMNRNPEMIGN
jgi:hypothetical protein